MTAMTADRRRVYPAVAGPTTADAGIFRRSAVRRRRSSQRYSLLAVLLMLLCGQAALAQPVTTQVDTENSVISYSGDAILHGWTGVSHAAEGMLTVDLADPANSRIEIRAPIESFDSGNSNRDSNMLDVVDIEKYPDVRFVSTQVGPGTEPGTWLVRGDLTLHGQTHPVELPVRITSQDGVFEAAGAFDVSITKHGMERPRIMLVRVDDVITVDFTIRAPLQTASQ